MRHERTRAPLQDRTFSAPNLLSRPIEVAGALGLHRSGGSRVEQPIRPKTKEVFKGVDTYAQNPEPGPVAKANETREAKHVGRRSSVSPVSIQVGNAAVRDAVARNHKDFTGRCLGRSRGAFGRRQRGKDVFRPVAPNFEPGTFGNLAPSPSSEKWCRSKGALLAQGSSDAVPDMTI